jgi:hypothetical protein
VAGDRQKIDAELVDASSDLPDRLGSVGVHDAVLAGRLRAILDRLDGADLVVGMHDADKDRVRRDRSAKIAEVDPPCAVDGGSAVNAVAADHTLIIRAFREFVVSLAFARFPTIWLSHCKHGAPRSMKLGTTRSPWRYDAVARHTLQSVKLRRPAILHYASWAAVFPLRGLWHFTLHDPGCCGVGPFPIGLAVEVGQLDHGSELGYGCYVKCPDVFRDRPVLAFSRSPEIRKGCEVHADRQHFLDDIHKTSFSPSARQVSGTAHRPGVRSPSVLIPVPIEHGRDVEDHAKGNKASTRVPCGRGDRPARTRDAAHFTHGEIGLRYELQNEH